MYIYIYIYTYIYIYINHLEQHRLPRTPNRVGKPGITIATIYDIAISTITILTITRTQYDDRTQPRPINKRLEPRHCQNNINARCS